MAALGAVALALLLTLVALEQLMDLAGLAAEKW